MGEFDEDYNPLEKPEIAGERIGVETWHDAVEKVGETFQECLRSRFSPEGTDPMHFHVPAAFRRCSEYRARST